jgi:hypothetical protein
MIEIRNDEVRNLERARAHAVAGGGFREAAKAAWSASSTVNQDHVGCLRSSCCGRPKTSLWTLEMAQFAMVAYYILGGPYSIQMGANVRMDLFYGDWSQAKKAQFDAFTVLCLIFYLLCAALRGAPRRLFAGLFRREPLGFFLDLIACFVTGGADAAAEKLGHRTQPDRVAALSVADQADHDHRHLPDAAAGHCQGIPEGHSPGSRRSDPLMSYEMIAILMFSSMMLMLLTGQRVFGAIGFVAVVAALRSGAPAAATFRSRRR